MEQNYSSTKATLRFSGYDLKIENNNKMTLMQP